QSPLRVARRFVEDNYADDRGQRLLHHRGLFYTWAGTHWVEARIPEVRSLLYRWLGEAVFMKAGELHPFDPTKPKGANVLEALAADAQVSDRLESAAWIDAERGPFPAADVVAMQNGLLRLSTRTLHPHTPAFFNVHVLPFAYEPSAPDPSVGSSSC